MKSIGCPVLEQSAAAVGKIILDRSDGVLPDWHQTLLITLAGGPQNPKVQVQVADPEPAQLRDPQAGGIKAIPACAIPQTVGRELSGAAIIRLISSKFRN